MVILFSVAKTYSSKGKVAINDNRYSLRKYLVLNKQTMAPSLGMLFYTAMYVWRNRRHTFTIGRRFSENSQLIG